MNKKEIILSCSLVITTIIIIFLVMQLNAVPNQGKIENREIDPVNTIPTVISPPAPTSPAPISTPTPKSSVSRPTQIDNHIVFSLDGTHEFGKRTEISYPYDSSTDIDEEMTIKLWFRRDVFNKHQFLISKGHHGDREGWRLMIKEEKPPYQKNHVQFDVGNRKSLNYYKSLNGILNDDLHSLVILFNANKIYIDSKGTETHGVILLDGKTDYYMACPSEDKGNPPISDVIPLKESMFIGRHSDKKNKYYFDGALNNVTIMDVDIGIEAAKEWHEMTKRFI